MKIDDNVGSFHSGGKSFAIAGLLPALLLGSAACLYGQMTTGANASGEDGDFAKWYDGNYAFGPLPSLRTAPAEKGIFLAGRWQGTYYDVAAGGRHRRGASDEELLIAVRADFGKMLGIVGLSGNAAVRWRDGSNISDDVGATGQFNPSSYQGGKEWRLLPFYLTWESGSLFSSVKNFITLSGGWQNPYFHFLTQPSAKLFRNTAINTAQGIGFNGVPWTSNYAAWGGYVKLRPTDWYYAQAGLYQAIPNGPDTSNHGTYFRRASNGRNGSYFVSETGVTPRMGASKLPGTYAMGYYYFGLDNKTFSGAQRAGRSGVYLQADQAFYRPDAPSGKGAGSSLDGFALFTFAPKDSNPVPFYFHAGLVYTGLGSRRPKDQVGIVFGRAEYSGDRNSAQRKNYSSEAVLEADYRFQLNKWAFIQPYVQYIKRPKGDGSIPDATVWGVNASLTL